MQKLNPSPRTSTLSWSIAHLVKFAVLALVSVTLTPIALAEAASSAQAALPSTQEKNYRIPKGTLDQVLNRFAAIAQITLSIDASLTAGKSSAGLNGTYSIEQGLTLLLKDTDLLAKENQRGVYSLHKVAAMDANADADASHLPQINVSATAMLSGTTEGSERYSATALNLLHETQSIRRTPQPVTVITHEMLKQQALRDVQQALTTAATGVTMYYTDSERISYYARGYEIDGFQVNGLPTYRNGSAMLKTDTATLDRVEVVLGAAGLLRGAGHPSASVNMVRKRPTSRHQRMASMTIGAWGQRRADLDLSGPINAAGTVRGRFVAAAENKQLFQTVRHDDHRVLYGVLQADLSANAQLTAGIEYAKQNATGAWGNLPAAADGSQLGLARKTFLGAAWNEWNREKKEGFLEFEHLFDNEWSLTAAAMHSRSELKNFRQSYFTPNAQSPYSGKMNASIYKDAAVYQTAASLNVNGPFALLGRQHQLILGAQIQHVRDDSMGKGWSGMSLVDVPDIRTWNPYTDIPLPMAQGQPSGRGYNRIRQNGLYAATRISISKDLVATLGSRISWWRYQAPNSPSRNYAVNRAVVPYYGLVYDLNRDWSVYASHSEIFTPQRAFNAQGRVLPPIRGKTSEAGLKGELINGRLNAVLSVFHTLHVGKAIDDTSSALHCQPHSPNGYCQMAGGKTRSLGFEAQLQGQISPQWSISGGYTNTRTRYVRDNDETKIGAPLRTLDPRQMMRIFTSHRLQGAWRGLTVGTGIQTQSKKYATTQGITYRQGGLTLYNAMASYQFTPNTAVQLNVNNLFDKVYFAQVGSGINNYYGEPRHWQLTFSSRF